MKSHLVVQIFHRRLDYSFRHQAVLNTLISMVQRKELHRNDYLWLLNTLSELRSRSGLSLEDPFIGIWLPMLMDSATKWNHKIPPDIVLLEAVAMFAAISCTRGRPVGRFSPAVVTTRGYFRIFETSILSAHCMKAPLQTITSN
jgi:hypothetical protein